MIDVRNLFKSFSVCEVYSSTGMKKTYSRIRLPQMSRKKHNDIVLVYKYYDNKPCDSMTMGLEEARLDMLVCAINNGNIMVDGVTYKIDVTIEKTKES